ncbi:uncharacterized protein [Spinacia oleracea]|uniref:SWIM-type domain-containing protein n=1 Tax=Spinacia oleracea TaxID=3562 RepID=A0ABM3RSJ9_SPIOL|nr:uncharacterized protein LOC130472155 [Spinacia oleracea]
MEVKCVVGCPFRLYGSWDTRRACFVVKSIDGDHTCCRNMEANRQLKSTWMAKQFLEIFKARPHWPAKEIVETVKRAYKVVIKRDTAYKVKYAAHRMLHGSMKDHYNKLGRYIQALKDASPESHIVLVTVPSKQSKTPVFQRLFLCFDGIRKGWLEGCRKIMCVDACFLKTFLGGQLMSAVGRDGNDQMYPIAWAVVEGENNSSWEWFFTQLQICLRLGDGTGLTLVSDEHRAILSSAATVFPNCEHRHCARHIFALWHKTFRGDDMKLMFWKAAFAYNMADFNDAIKEMEAVDPDAVVAFKKYNPKLFCRAYLSTENLVDVIVNNMAETFNGYIINARTKHLIYMLEDIRSALMQRLITKKMEMEKSVKIVCPRIQVKLEKEKSWAANCDALISAPHKFQVYHFMDSLRIDLGVHKCTCRKWDLTGIPCCHAVSCIFFLHKNAEDFVHGCYKRDCYLTSYSGEIEPCVGERHWPVVDLPIDPPPIKIGPGRPRTNRRKDPFENPKKPGRLTKHGVQMTCSICKSTTHNKRRCPSRDTATASTSAAPLPNPAPATVAKKTSAPLNPAPAPAAKKTSVPANRRAEKQPVASEPVGKRARTSTTSEPPTQQSSVHFDATAQPTRTGKNGRVIYTGKGSRGGGRGSRGRGGGRGRGRGRGVGVLFGIDGTPFMQVSSNLVDPVVL